MLHAIAHIFIGALYMATLFGLDKSVAIALHAATYSLKGLAELAKLFGIALVVRMIGMLGLVLTFQTVEIGCLVHGDERPAVYCPVASVRAVGD